MTTLPLWMDAYLERIGWSGPALSDRTGQGAEARAVLAALAAAHAATIPFENITSFLHQPVSVIPDEVVEKLVHQHRGGYCFEQNLLLQMVLEALGYRVTPLLGRVLWINPDIPTARRTHMVLQVTLTEAGDAREVIVDVGFGGNVLTGVLDLVDMVEQTTPHGRFRLESAPGYWLQQAEIAGEWRPTYMFTLEPQFPVDFELANYWVSTHPGSHFREMLAAAMAPPGKRLALRNQQFTIHYNDGTRHQEQLSPAEVVTHLTDIFGIQVPDAAALIARLEGLEV